MTPAPCGWLHMEVLEKDKMEWMTDVPLHPQPSEVGGWCLPCSQCAAEQCSQQSMVGGASKLKVLNQVGWAYSARLTAR